MDLIAGENSCKNLERTPTEFVEKEGVKSRTGNES